MYFMAKHFLCVSPFGNLHTFSKHFHQRVDFGILEFFFSPWKRHVEICKLSYIVKKPKKKSNLFSR